MGSDDGKKSLSRQRQWWFFHPSRSAWMMRLIGVVVKAFSALTIIALFTNVLNWRILPAPELILGDHFSASHYEQYLPPQCLDLAQRFHHCQQTANETVVLACHRKWCGSMIGGHCAPCAGIGDRSRFMLSHIQSIVDNQRSQHCIRIQLDYPLQDMALLDTAVYQDPAGWWGELGRYRSYHVQQQQQQQLNSQNAQERLSETMVVSHFFQTTPRLKTKQPYDPCLYHILFQPNARMQQEIDIYNTQIIDSLLLSSRRDIPSIGIHFRTGDVASFGITLSGDNRVTHLEQAWTKMLLCADSLAQRLYPNINHTTLSRTAANQQVPYFLATDHAGLKQWVQEQQQQQQTASLQHRIFTTAIQPAPYLRGLAGDRNALLELHLLASRQGLVTNLRPQRSNYTGKAGRTSYFSKLAQRIGFIPDDHVMECSMED